MTIKTGASGYSWQHAYYIGAMTLEDIIADLAAAGGTGFELLPEQMLPGDNFNRIEDRFKDQWFDWMAKYHMQPSCLDHYDDYNLYKNRTLTIQEQVDLSEHYLKLAQQLGFGCVRILSNTPVAVLEKLIPLAEDYGIKIGLEIHAPLSMKSEWADQWRNIIERSGTKLAGFIPDFGIFSKRPYSVLTDNFIKNGARPAIINHMIRRYSEIAQARAHASQITKFGTEVFQFNPIMLEIEDEVKSMGASPLELLLLRGPYIYDNPEWLAEIAPLIFHVHGKFYTMVDDGSGSYTDSNIDTEGAVQVLKKLGYQGFISSEYEAPNFTAMFGGKDPLPYLDESEAVHRHQAMLKKLLA